MKPTSENDLSLIVRDTTDPLAIVGGGTRGIELDGHVVHTSGLSGITIYEPGALTIVAQAGTPLAEIDAALAAENQRLPFEPMDHRGLLGTSGTPTLGGVIAANISGPRRIQSGAARDFTLGVRYVDGTGEVIKNGGRVMKNVTGYDLVKLMCGSFGTLGILTEVALKVLPVTETQATLVLRTGTDVDAVQAMAAALGSPFEVSGAAYLPEHGVCLRVEGFEASVAYRLDRLKAALAPYATDVDVLDAAASADRWVAIRDVAPFHGSAGDVWRVSCKPSDGPALAARSGAEAWFYDWAGGLIWLRCAAGHDLRAQLGRFDGHATLVRGDAQNRPRFHPEAPGVARLTEGLRARFDPRGIFNPGLMGRAPEGVS